jgi:Protein of unknown function (DUF4231)
MTDKPEESSDQYEGEVVDEHIRYYADKVTIYTRLHNTLQLIILLGSIVLPFLIGNAGMVQEAHLPQWLPIAISLIVAISAGIEGYFKFGETCAKFRSACQLITREKRWYKYQIEPYQGLSEEDRLSKFKEQVEAHMSALYPSKDDRTPGKQSPQTEGKLA